VRVERDRQPPEITLAGSPCYRRPAAAANCREAQPQKATSQYGLQHFSVAPPMPAEPSPCERTEPAVRARAA
jgi:hypothetical protein